MRGKSVCRRDRWETVVKYVLAILACGAEILAFCVVGAALGWERVPGIIPMAILLAIIGSTWAMITKRDTTEAATEETGQILPPPIPQPLVTDESTRVESRDTPASRTFVTHREEDPDRIASKDGEPTGTAKWILLAVVAVAVGGWFFLASGAIWRPSDTAQAEKATPPDSGRQPDDSFGLPAQSPVHYAWSALPAECRSFFVKNGMTAGDFDTPEFRDALVSAVKVFTALDETWRPENYAVTIHNGIHRGFGPLIDSMEPTNLSSCIDHLRCSRVWRCASNCETAATGMSPSRCAGTSGVTTPRVSGGRQDGSGGEVILPWPGTWLQRVTLRTIVATGVMQ